MAAVSHLCNKMTALWGLPLPGRKAVSVVFPGPTGHFINQRKGPSVNYLVPCCKEGNQISNPLGRGGRDADYTSAEVIHWHNHHHFAQLLSFVLHIPIVTATDSEHSLALFQFQIYRILSTPHSRQTEPNNSSIFPAILWSTVSVKAEQQLSLWQHDSGL